MKITKDFIKRRTSSRFVAIGQPCNFIAKIGDNLFEVYADRELFCVYRPDTGKEDIDYLGTVDNKKEFINAVFDHLQRDK